MNTQQALAEAMQVTKKLVNNIETARKPSYRYSSLVRLEHVLGWASGSVESVLGGGEPVVKGCGGDQSDSLPSQRDHSTSERGSGRVQSNLPMPTAAMTGRVDLSSLSDAELAARNTGTVAELMAIALEFRRRAESSPGPDDDEFDDDTVFARWDASLGPPPEPPPPSARPARGA